MLVVGELSEDNQFPTIARDLPEAAKYTLLWAIRMRTGCVTVRYFGCLWR